MDSVNNITYLLKYIATFIKQQSLLGKKASNFPQLKEIGFVA